VPVVLHRSEAIRRTADGRLKIRARAGALWRDVMPGLAAFAVDEPGGPPALSLALPRGHIGPPGAPPCMHWGRTSTPLPDWAGGNRSALDVAVGPARVSLRCGPALSARLAPLCGRMWPCWPHEPGLTTGGGVAGARDRRPSPVCRGRHCARARPSRERRIPPRAARRFGWPGRRALAESRRSRL